MFLFFFKAKTDKKKPFISFYLKINFKDLKEGLEPQSKKKCPSNRQFPLLFCLIFFYSFLLQISFNCGHQWTYLAILTSILGTWLKTSKKKNKHIYIYIYTYKKKQKK